jgi:RHS repeat-associated protein
MKLRSAHTTARLALIILCLASPTGLLWAQNENETVGFQSNHAFESGQFGESIDILNGGVNLTTPIGPRYQLNQNLGYQLQIAYSSKIWQTKEWDNKAGLFRRGALGLGHLLHFGRIYRDVAYVNQQYVNASGQVLTQLDFECTWYYVSPDGNEHVIPGNYRPDQGSLTCSDYPIGSYTTDTTFYSFRVASGTLQGWPGTGTPPTLEIVTPDQIRYTFGQFVQVNGNGGPHNVGIGSGGDGTIYRRYNHDYGGWYVTEIQDLRAPGTVGNPTPPGAWVRIEYDTRPGFEHLISRITDSDDREILFTNECEPDLATPSDCKESDFGSNAHNRPATRIRRIDLPVFKGAAAVDNTGRGHYDFTYEWKNVTNLLNSSTEPQNVLRTITYPQFMKHTGSTESYTMSFDYNGFGEMSSRTLPTGGPTGGIISYLYSQYDYLGVGLFGTAYNPQADSKSRHLDSKSILLNGTSFVWHYTRQATSATNPQVVAVTDPFGNDTLYHYHASIQDSQAQLGLCGEDGWAPEWNDGLIRRIEYYQGTGGSRTLVRMETHEYDSDPGQTCAFGQRSKKNLRLSKVTTTYLDYGGRQSTVSYSDWDDLGHWRVVTEVGSDVIGTRSTRMEYLGTDPGRFVYREVTDGNRVLSRTDHIYSGLNLVLNIDRLNLPATPGTGVSSTTSPGDIATVYTYDANGNVIQKEMSDLGATQAGGTWQATSPKYRIRYTWQGGYLTSKTFFDFEFRNDYFPWKAIDRDRDGNTGLIYASRDTARVLTGYSYDALSRLTDITPASPEYPTQIEYAGIRRTSVRQGDPLVMAGNYDCALTAGDFIAACYDYDELGRLVKTQKRSYDPTNVTLGNAYQTTEYDIAGRVTFQSEWLWPSNTTCATAPMPRSCGTVYDFDDPDDPTIPAQIDAFGRVRTVTTSDGKVTRTDYFGQSTRVTVQGVQGTMGPFNSTTTYFRDVWGRLTKVEMPSGGGADAIYGYDLRDNLTQVDLVDKTTLQRQTRLFTHDALNRLYWSWNPESGTSEVLGYDPQGNVTDQVDASGIHMLSTYDGAGRPTRLSRRDDRTPAQVITLRQNVYDEGGLLGPTCAQGGGFGCSGGRLTTARDYDDTGSLTLTRTFRYTALNGRRSSLSPLFAGAASVGSLVYVYDYFGMESRTTYPEGPTGKGGAFAVRYVHANGHLTRVEDAQTTATYGSLKYNAAGGVQTVTTTGNISTMIEPDTPRNRPRKITIGAGNYDPDTDSYSGGTHYRSGLYQYDGAGNIAAIGSSTYAYDAANRIVQAVELVFNDAMQRSHVYAYDDFGNMTSDTYLDSSIRQVETFGMSSSRDNHIQQHTSTITDLATGTTLLNTTRTLAYDLRGDLVAGDTQTHDYDSRHRMVGLRMTTGNQDVARYVYDGSAARVRKEDAARGVLTFYVRDAQGKLMSEFRRARKGTNVPEWAKHYVYLGDRLVALKENQVPGPVGGLAATTGPGYVDLTWKPNPADEKVSSYKVYRTSYPPSTWVLVGTSTQPALIDWWAGDGVWYQYVVTARGPYMYEGYGSDPLVVQAASIAAPQAPTGLSRLEGDRRVDLTWTANPAADFVIGYNVYRDGAATPLNSSLVTSTYFADLNLTNGTTYTYVVKAVNAWSKVSQPSSSVTATPGDYGRPAPPRDVTAVPDCASPTPKIRVRWSPPFGAIDVAHYLVYRSPELPVAGCTSNCASAPVTGTQFIDAAVVIGTVYQYWVVAVDGSGNVSSRWVGVVATPRNVSAAVAVPEVPAVTAGDGKVTVRLIFPNPAPYQTMRVYRRQNARQDCEAYQLLESVSTSGADCPAGQRCHKDYTDTGVPNAVAYDYVVTNVGAGGAESGYSKAALAIPVAPPIAYTECVEDLRSTSFSGYKDGAQKDPGGNLKRLKVRVEPPPGVPQHHPLTASTAGGTLAFFKGFHLYDHWVPRTMGAGDHTSLKPIPVDVMKGQCIIDTTTSCNHDGDCPWGQVCNTLDGCRTETGVACFDDSNCPAGQVCKWPPYPHCADSPTNSCRFDSECSSVYCTDEFPLVGTCAADSTRYCAGPADCAGLASSNCRNGRSIDGYLGLYADDGFNTFTSYLFVDHKIVRVEEGCLALRAVYKVYANGKWQTVESGFSDNFSPNLSNPSGRCATYTPQVFNWDLHPGCASSSGPPPQPLAAPTPTVSQTAPNTVTVSWTPAGVCKNDFYTYCEAGGVNTCPAGQICFADPVYTLPSESPGHCDLQAPAACDASHPCSQPNQVCEMGGLDGYHIYVTEKQGSGTSTTFREDHFVRNRPAVSVDKNTTSYTFTGLAPTYGGGTPTQFSFRLATFANGGKITEMSPPSGFITPMAAVAPMPAPQSVKTDIYETGGIRISWLPGAEYVGLRDYEVHRSMTPGGPYTPLATTTATTWFDSTATQNLDYYYVVKAVSVLGVASDPSPEVAARALPPGPPAEQPLRPPLRFSAQAVRSDHTSTNWWRYIDLSWCPSDTTAGVTGYRVYRSKQSRGPYTLMNTNQDVSPLCIDGKHRCEITSPSAGVFEVSSPSTCAMGKFSTCRLIDKTVDVTPAGNDYPNQVQNYVYYYVVTAVKRDGGGVIVHESAYSVENQGWPNYCSGTLENCNRHDPDILPSVTCGLSETASLEVIPPSPELAGTNEAFLSREHFLAPYRTIGVGEPTEGPQPSPPPPTPSAVAKWIYFHLDHLGSPRVLTNATGLLVSTHRYMPFGDERPVLPQESTTTRQFTAHERDKESGLDYMLARYYGGPLGRFMGPDPGASSAPEVPQRWNLYHYARNNPIRFRDPDGRTAREALEYRRAFDQSKNNWEDFGKVTELFYFRFQRKGRYGGDDWTGSEWNGSDYSREGVTSVDEAYRHHDFAYSICEQSGGDQACYLKADQILVAELFTALLLDPDLTADWRVHGAFALGWYSKEVLRQAYLEALMKAAEEIRRKCGPHGCPSHQSPKGPVRAGSK